MAGSQVVAGVPSRACGRIWRESLKTAEGVCVDSKQKLGDRRVPAVLRLLEVWMGAERGQRTTRNWWEYMLIHYLVQNSWLVGTCCRTQGPRSVLCDDVEGWGGLGWEEGVTKREGSHTCAAGLHCCTAETNTALDNNYPPRRRNPHTHTPREKKKRKEN